MRDKPLLSLPSVTALNTIIGGYYNGTDFVGSRISTHADLEDFFGAIGIPLADAPSINKKLRATITQLNGAPKEHELLKKLLEQVADPRFYRFSGHEEAMDMLNKNLRGDGLEIRKVGERFRLFNLAASTIAADALVTKADALDLVSVRENFERAVAQAEADPAGAITAACSMVESVCKCILDEMEVPYPPKKDIKGLVTEVAKHLNLSPGREDLPPDWEADIRQILSGLFSVSGGIGALRTHAGDAHGRGKRPMAVSSRIARLAIHSASTISVFYIETWQRAVRN